MWVTVILMKGLKDIKGFAVSLGRAMPLLVGGLAGVFLPPERGWASVFSEVKNGNGQGAMNSAIASYTFYNAQGGEFHTSAGTGVKTLLAGAFISELIGWVLD